MKRNESGRKEQMRRSWRNIWSAALSSALLIQLTVQLSEDRLPQSTRSLAVLRRLHLRRNLQLFSYLSLLYVQCFCCDCLVISRTGLISWRYAVLNVSCYSVRDPKAQSYPFCFCELFKKKIKRQPIHPAAKKKFPLNIFNKVLWKVSCSDAAGRYCTSSQHGDWREVINL